MNLHQVELHLVDFEKYLLNPNDPSLSEQKKLEFFHRIKEIGKKLGSSFFGLIKRQVNTEAIVAYEATEILFDELAEVLDRRGYVASDRVPQSFYYIAYDFNLHQSYYNSRFDTYVTVRCANKWFSKNYELEVFVDKDFNFENYKKEIADDMKWAYDDFKDDQDLDLYYDYTDNPQTMTSFIQEVHQALNIIEKVTIHQLKQYY